MTGAADDEERAYRWALGGFATGVVLITIDTAAGAAGIVVNSFTSVSLNPRIVLWCLGDASDRYAMFARADRWGVNVLGVDQQDLSARFASPGAFEAGDLDITRLAGAPVLKSALTHLSCRTVERTVMGDHLMIVGAVEGFDTAGVERDGLTYFRGRYGRAALED